MSLRKFNPNEPVKQYEKALLPAWTEAREAMQRMQAASSADKAIREAATDELAERYPSLKAGR